MAHGTGEYWNRQYKADLETKEYAVIFFRLFDYYYPQMSDSYEPDCMAMDEYKVEVRRWRKDRWGHEVADHLSEQAETGSIDRETANRIYWNLKNREISFEEVQRYFEGLKK